MRGARDEERSPGVTQASELHTASDDGENWHDLSSFNELILTMLTKEA